MELGTHTASRNVLVCHDNGAVLSNMAQWLKDDGFNPICVTDAQQAKTCLSNMDMTLMLVAQRFSGEDGLHFCANMSGVRKEKNTLALLVLDTPDDEVIRGLEGVGVQDYVLSDCAQSTFRHRIRTTLNQLHIPRTETRMDNMGLLRTRSETTKHIQAALRTMPQSEFAALLVIDVDNFRRVNSSFGFDSGDQALNTIESRLCNLLRHSDSLIRKNNTSKPGDTLARFGGDEFVLFVENLRSPEDAQRIANRCLQSVHEPLVVDGQSLVLTASVGIALTVHESLDAASLDANMLMQHAERAMYVAKKRGGNTLQYHQSEMATHAGDSLQIENALRDALSQNQLSLHYQPQVDTVSGAVTSMEVLCRWFHPTLGQITPDRFIPVAEETGLIVPIGEWVLRSACHQAKKWLDEGLTLERIAVNVSAFQFYRPDFVDSTIAILVETGLPAHCLELELTESLIMSDAQENIRKLETLKSLGIRLAVDDFGTGYSSLSYLKSLPIDTLKIDRSFISNLQDDEKDHAIVGAILGLAAKLELSVVAEGVEQQSQMAFLRENQCATLQGYFFSPAKPADEAASLLGKSLAAA